MTTTTQGNAQEVLLTDLKPAPQNANRMEPARFEHLRQALERDGFLQPVLVRRDGAQYEIVDGHHRVEAARALGLASVPAVITDVDANTAARLAIAMNRLRGDLDLTTVGQVFADLIDAGVDPLLLEGTGFTKDELNDLLEMAEQDADDVMTSITPPDTEASPTSGTFVLEVEFDAQADLVRAKKALKRAAGKGNSLGAGLLAVLGEV
jgi:hypothetical protein